MNSSLGALLIISLGTIAALRVVALSEVFSPASTRARVHTRILGGLNPWEFHQIAGVSLKTALARLDHCNKQDPRSFIDANGDVVPQQLRSSRRVYEEVLRLDSDASDPLLLAARSFGIQRWKNPRNAFPMTAQGRELWEQTSRKLYASVASRILLEVGYDAVIIQEVTELLLQTSHTDGNALALERALVFDIDSEDDP